MVPGCDVGAGGRVPSGWFSWRVRGGLDRAAWQGALDDVVARHEVLRTALEEVDWLLGAAGGRRGRASRCGGARRRPGGTEAQRLAAACAEAGEFARQRFDLASAPLVRAGVWVLDPQDCVAGGLPRRGDRRLVGADLLPRADGVLPGPAGRGAGGAGAAAGAVRGLRGVAAAVAVRRGSRAAARVLARGPVRGTSSGCPATGPGRRCDPGAAAASS